MSVSILTNKTEKPGSVGFEANLNGQDERAVSSAKFALSLLMSGDKEPVFSSGVMRGELAGDIQPSNLQATLGALGVDAEFTS